jgi:hypothetical protein
VPALLGMLTCMTALVFQSAASPKSGFQRENHFPIFVQLCCLLADQGLESGIVSIKKLVLDSSYGLELL